MQGSTFPMAKDHDEYMRKYIQDQIEKRFTGEYGFAFDFYILCAHPNTARHFKHIQTSIWSTIWWIQQMPMSPLYHAWTEKAKPVNQMARVCIIGDWSRQNSYPIFLYDLIKELSFGIGIAPSAGKILLETDLHKVPFGKAFTYSQCFERDSKTSLMGELDDY